MNQPQGSLCIVLHGHLPFVLNHGTWPHGEVWLYEAARETYLPLLALLDEIACHGVTPNLTIGLTPVLLEQLAHERFKEGFVTYLHERIDRAARDVHEFDSTGQTEFALLARRWERCFSRALEHFNRIERNIPAEFSRLLREGMIQILTSAATHAYLPLLLDDRCLGAQLSVGLETTRRHLSSTPTGIWLPECAYRPAWQHWAPVALHLPGWPRAGMEASLAARGIDHFFVDAHLFQAATPVGTLGPNGDLVALGPADVMPDPARAQKRGWRSPLEAAGVMSGAQTPNVFAFARHPHASEQVWSSKVGYPGNGEYLEFHRQHGQQGLRYWRVTDQRVGLNAKQLYNPEDAAARARADASDFCTTVGEALRGYSNQTGRAGVVVAAFDAELFGHWWAEGVAFLREVLLTLHEDQDAGVRVRTTSQVLHDPDSPPDKVVRLPEGSWGERGDHSVWLNDQTRWMWEIEYRAEMRLIEQIKQTHWRTRPDVELALRRAARELLLLQASDWPFVIHSKGAVDYGVQRFCLHATRFDRAMSVVSDLDARRDLSPLQKIQVDEIDAHDSVFSELNLTWWT